MQLGFYTFGDTAADPATGQVMDPAQRLRNLVEEAVLADEVGLDVFGVGEHHRRDFAVSAPAVVLAAIAERTKRITLASAVTVLSSDDPVRVFQQFATLDLLSGGRAEIMAGRGSFTESYPLFGYALDEYDALFEDKLDLLLKLRENERVTWTGRGRPPLDDQPVYPRPFQERLPVWVAVGGNPNSVIRAARLGLPLAIAIIGGDPKRFAPLVQLYREAAAHFGHNVNDMPVSINSIGFVGETSRDAADTFFPPYAAVMTKLGRERGWPPMTRNQYEALRSPLGSLVVGSPDEVVDKILYEHDLFRHDRFLLQASIGDVPHRDVMRAIELFGTKVAPAVRKALAGSGLPTGAAAGAAGS